ncbi:sensor histidine kinase [Rhizobium tubonense]|uniref:Blue-light-activated histidine kinase n=1 Tax=Rhizobium tubonense TaxID=484088 RepID=A0A2W4DYT9_9HYPH|nr:HWE histidine kinase domain-containing protein [Rhizobium tubonense]PZM08956.1 histidine kinase [Rhizobium tubonense]
MTATQATDTPDWGLEQLRNAIKAAGVALWTWNVDDDTFLMDTKGYDLWDVNSDKVLTFEHLSEKIHPADRDRVRAAFVATRAIVGPYEIDFRILTGASDVRWISARGQGDDVGIIGRKMTGVFLDVTGRKQAEEGHELLAGEMSHRVKNLLALAAGLTSITSRSTTTKEEMAHQLTQRLTALGRAHDLVRPLPSGQGKAALLGDLFAVLLAPYDDVGAFAGRIRVAVPRAGVGEAAATHLALVIHELATNSLKYGALSVGAGTLDVSGLLTGDDVEIVWTEQGGPEVVPPEGTAGYGSRLLQRTISGPLAGSLAYDWTQSGVLITLRVKADSLTK